MSSQGGGNGMGKMCETESRIVSLYSLNSNYQVLAAAPTDAAVSGSTGEQQQ